MRILIQFQSKLAIFITKKYINKYFLFKKVVNIVY